MTDAPLPSARVSDLHPAGTSSRTRPGPVITLLARTIWTPDFEIDLDDRCARYPDGEGVRFTARQWQVLELLVRAIPRAVSTARLAEAVFGTDAGTEAEAIEQTAQLTRRYARRQVGWFARYPATWFAGDDRGRVDAALQLVLTHA